MAVPSAPPAPRMSTHKYKLESNRFAALCPWQEERIIFISTVLSRPETLPQQQQQQQQQEARQDDVHLGFWSVLPTGECHLLTVARSQGNATSRLLGTHVTRGVH